MRIFPAIDILDGKAVRLRQGRYDQVTVYNDDPVEQARIWADGGAEWLHVVDLDGARDGVPTNIDVIARMVREVGVPVQTGGGIRTMETLDRLHDVGVTRTVLGTSLVRDPEFVAAAAHKYAGIVAGVDARDGKVAVEGWREGTEREVTELIEELAALGVQRVVYTDISRDGMQTGVNARAYRELSERSPMTVIASGGVSTLDDIRALAAIGRRVEGAIVGTALYEARFTLSEAIAASRDLGMGK
ncbi:MAG: 1-(5-phosphoribosyl)-5-[(5-phosphoribosylamino)methylideneamino]imidazole-4-carboxamide isomerase [Coriobacteriia bacterium]|jgi:phosphoribosylformimino-5-aminoimidazole carboxamide ribotide isomerase|nr:1-(5-phosphoribosyl)-5-[(5-phosphoribosylamino)methylideneamino]imidazole-4-carboxamide isomerase [Coriobacteriia bacterium]